MTGLTATIFIVGDKAERGFSHSYLVLKNSYSYFRHLAVTATQLVQSAEVSTSNGFGNGVPSLSLRAPPRRRLGAFRAGLKCLTNFMRLLDSSECWNALRVLQTRLHVNFTAFAAE